MFTFLSGFYVLDKKMSVNSTAEEDSGSKHSTDMGFCPLQVSAAVSVPFWQKFLQRFGKKRAACGISVSKSSEKKNSACVRFI